MTLPANDDFIKIAVIENTFEAQMLAGALESESIPFRMVSYHDTAYDGLFQAQRGWGEIRAAEHHRDTILEMLDDLRSEDRSAAPPASEPEPPT